MAPPATFPFPYFGHAYSEYVIVDVFAWFERPPPEDVRARANSLLARVHSFFGGTERAHTVHWSERVVQKHDVLDSERKHVSPSDPRIVAALKSADLKRYGTTKAAMKAVPFAMHLLVDQALEQLHREWPIAFAVRVPGPKDRTTPWHDWSLSQQSGTFARILEHVERRPSNAGDPSGQPWPHAAPWLMAVTAVARACTKRERLASLPAADKAVLADLCATVSSVAQPEPSWADNSVAFSDLTECRDALLAIAAKLGAGPATGSAHDVVDRILLEAAQFEFTRIRLSECPTFEAVKALPSRFEVAIDATERVLRELERLSGHRPGETVLVYGGDDQQRLDVLSKVISQLLRRKGTFGESTAVAMVKTLASTTRPLGAWLPFDLIVDKLAEYVATGPSSTFTNKVKRLLELQYPLPRDDREGRARFEALLR